MRSKAAGVLTGLAVLGLFVGQAAAQDAPAAASGLQTGPATVAPHWSKYAYPRTIPEGATYYIIVRDDTLWDLSKRFLGNPYLWPQIWDRNKYITDAHWIYPGDPLIIPKVAVLAEKAGATGAEGGLEGEEGAGEERPGQGAVGGGAGSELYPVTEESTMQCAPYVVQDREDESLRLIGSEQGATKLAFADRDILYINKGSNAGIKAGDVFSFHHAMYAVKHPATGKKIGTKVETTGWGRAILVEENVSTVIIEQACADIHVGDYLRTFEKVNVPVVLRRIPADRLTPPTGKTRGYIIDIAEDSAIAGTGHILSIDIGSDSGIAPGNVLVVYRTMYPSVPTPRNVLGELAVIAARDKTATAKVTYSNDAIMNGDEVELR